MAIPFIAAAIIRTVAQTAARQFIAGFGRPGFQITGRLVMNGDLRARLEKKVREATARALTRAAMNVREEIPAALERDLDRPTPWIKRGVYIKAARPDQLYAVVGFMDKQARIMQLQIAGGERRPSARGIKLPGNIQLNTFGNVPRGVIDRLKQAAQDGTLGKALSRRLGGEKARKGGKPVELFVGKPAGEAWKNAPMGVWRRVAGGLEPVVVFTDKSVRYRPRFNLEALGERVVKRDFQRLLESEMRKRGIA